MVAFLILFYSLSLIFLARHHFDLGYYQNTLVWAVPVMCAFMLVKGSYDIMGAFSQAILTVRDPSEARSIAYCFVPFPPRGK